MRRHDAYVGLIRSTVVGFAMLMGAPALAADSKTTPTPTVSLTQGVHFTDAKGQDLVVGPGEYRVEVAGKSGLKLTPADGKEPIIIEGRSGPVVEVPLALSVPVNEDEHHLVLLLPEGKAIQVVGSPSGIISRSPSGVPLSSTRKIVDVIFSYRSSSRSTKYIRPAPSPNDIDVVIGVAPVNPAPKTSPFPKAGMMAPIMPRGVEGEPATSGPTGQEEKATAPK